MGLSFVFYTSMLKKLSHSLVFILCKSAIYLFIWVGGILLFFTLQHFFFFNLLSLTILPGVTALCFFFFSILILDSLFYFYAHYFYLYFPTVLFCVCVRKRCAGTYVCLQTEDSARGLIIQQHASHLHKHSSINKAFFSSLDNQKKKPNVLDTELMFLISIKPIDSPHC